jgi:hypothetical protein
MELRTVFSRSNSIKAAGGVKLTTYLNLVSTLKMSGAILPLPLYAFMMCIKTKLKGLVRACHHTI